MKKISILWADDEIDILKPYIIFLENKGYEVKTAYNGNDAIKDVRSDVYDIIFLDENMPGLSGLETLEQIKSITPNTPVVLITKSEAENIMDKAVGAKIADYLIKPVNPNQILLTIKKYVQNRQLVSQKTITDYQVEFSNIGQLIGEAKAADDWINIYKKLVHWDLELSNSGEDSMNEVLKIQFNEANNQFARFIKNNYISWFNEKADEKPLLSPNLFKDKVFPLIDQGEKILVIVIDNLRYDHWKTISSFINQYFRIKSEEIYCSILPTVTQYSRNAMFAGLMPYEIGDLHEDIWLTDEEEGLKNQFEEELLQKQLNRLGKNYKTVYFKIQNVRDGQKLLSNYLTLLDFQLPVVIYNFVDMLSHARTDREMIRELANDEKAYRSLSLSWFENSTLFDLIKLLAGQKIKIIITTDHGSIRVFNPVRVIGDKNTSSNLRYKTGKNLNYKEKEVFEIKNPLSAHLPLNHITSKYIFTTNQDFFAYPNNYNYYVNYFKNTFQHGGVSMEEMLIPLILLEPLI